MSCPVNAARQISHEGIAGQPWSSPLTLDDPPETGDQNQTYTPPASSDSILFQLILLHIVLFLLTKAMHVSVI